MTEVEQDFLEVDRPIPGQNFVCLSFISPENVLEDKNLYTLYKFHLSQNEGCELTFSQFKDQYSDFSDLNEKTLQTEFDEICDFRTNVRGIKIRGVYDTQREANVISKGFKDARSTTSGNPNYTLKFTLEKYSMYYSG